MFNFSNLIDSLFTLPAEKLQKMPMRRQVERDFLRKYIYLNVASDKFAENCPKDFLVYIVTIETGSEELSNCDELSSSKYNEETCSSKLEFTNFTNNHNNSSRLRKRCIEESTINDLNLKETCSKSAQFCSKKSKYDSKSKIIKFLRKIIPSSGNNLKLRKRISFDEVYMCDYNYDHNSDFNGSKLEKDVFKLTSNPLMVFDPSAVSEYRNAEALREIVDFGIRIDNSEMTIKELIIKFIQDKSFEKDLPITSHGRLLLETEKRTLNLATESWMQQAKLQKEQQSNLQSTLNTVVHENRLLLEENENLVKQNEKLSSAIAAVKENSSSFNNPRTPNFFSSCLLDDMSKNNDKLRNKVNSLMNQMRNMEEVLKKLQKRTCFLEQQLSSSNGQLQNQKLLFDKTKTENEVQVAKLLHELNNSTTILRECSDAGNVIIEDLDIMEKTLRPFSKIINWDKFKTSSKSLLDLLHQCRWCLNELSRELSHQHGELNEANQEIKVLKCHIDSLNPLKQEIVVLKNKLETAMNAERTFEGAKMKNNELLVKLEEKSLLLEKLLQGKDEDLQSKDKIIRENEEEIERLTNSITNLKSDFNKLQMVTEKVSNDNNSMQVQIKGMAQVLTATGAGDIAKELANTQQKLIHIQTQYFAIAAENNIMLKQIENNKKERKTMADYQKSCYEQLQGLNNDLEAKDKSIESLKEKLDAEKQTVSALQAERVRHLEERTILTAIYERLKSEILKVDQLEGAVSSMNKKASRLAMIAEYNKQLGEKLQIEVAERDVAINELQNNVKELNDFQIETTKEKVALCEELNKVFSVKEVLNTKLACELEKNVLLDETKKEIQNNANLQLKEIQSVYNKEHTAMKNLIKDLKQLVTERDNLIETSKEFEDKCACLIIEREKLVEVARNLNQSNQKNEQKIVTLETILEKMKNELQELKIDRDEMNNLAESMKRIQLENECVNDENNLLRTTVHDLETNFERLKEDLETTKKSKEIFKTTCEELTERNDKLLRQVESQNNKIETMEAENEDLRTSMSSINDKFKCISEENERFSQETIRLESIISDKFQTNKNSGEVTPKYIENTLDDINARDEEIIELQDKIRDLESQVMEFNDLIQTVSKRRDDMSVAKNNLEKEVNHLTEECESYQQRILKLESILNSMETNNISVMEMEQERNAFISEMNVVKTEFQEKITTLGEQLLMVNAKYNEDREAMSHINQELETSKESKSNLEKAHRQMALKLLTAVRLLIAEKVARDKMYARMQELREQNDALVKDLEAKNRSINDYENKLNEYKITTKTLKMEKTKLSTELTNTNELIATLRGHIEMNEECDSQKACNLSDRIKEQEDHLASLKSQLDSCHEEMENLQSKADTFESACATLEFQKSEAILRYHELHAKTQAEQMRNEELQSAIQNVLSIIMQMKEDGSITKSAHADLLLAIRDHI